MVMVISPGIVKTPEARTSPIDASAVAQNDAGPATWPPSDSRVASKDRNFNVAPWRVDDSLTFLNGRSNSIVACSSFGALKGSVPMPPMDAISWRTACVSIGFPSFNRMTTWPSVETVVVAAKPQSVRSPETHAEKDCAGSVGRPMNRVSVRFVMLLLRTPMVVPRGRPTVMQIEATTFAAVSIVTVIPSSSTFSTESIGGGSAASGSSGSSCRKSFRAMPPSGNDPMVCTRFAGAPAGTAGTGKTTFLEPTGKANGEVNSEQTSPHSRVRKSLISTAPLPDAPPPSSRPPS